jgi:hypothetical protein
VNVFRMVAVVMLLTGSAHAQQPVMIQDFSEKTPQQKADDELREKFSKESPKKMPESNTKAPSADPWGIVRSGDAAKTSISKTSKTSISKTSASKASNSETVTSAKPRSKAGAAAE